MTASAGLLDTSVIVGIETMRPIRYNDLPAEQYVSVITLAELLAGVHSARDTETRSRRMQTVETYARLTTLPVDEAAAGQWARLRARLREAGRRVNVNDLWIAAIALARGLPVVTQDTDFDALADLGGPEIIRV